MDEADLVFGFGVGAFLIWASWKAFNNIDEKKMSDHSKEGWQMFSIWAIVFVLPVIVILLLTAD